MCATRKLKQSDSPEPEPDASKDDFPVWAANFSKKYSDVLQHWKEHGDPLKRGLALLITEAVQADMRCDYIYILVLLSFCLAVV